MEAETPNDLSRFAPLIASAERLLSARGNSPVRLGETELLSEEGRRNVLLRCRNLSGSSPPSFILKQAVTETWNPDDVESWDVQRFFRDWAGVQFLSALGIAPEISPRFYDGDRALGFFVIEDMGAHRSLVEPLLEGDADTATAALLTYARALGRMHAATIGQSERYEDIFQTLQPNATLSGKPGFDLSAFAEKLEMICGGMGIVEEFGLSDNLEAVSREMEQPGPFHVYIHGDPCPDNVFFIGERMVLIDFEFGRFGHALRDALYGRMPFPTCWCCNRLPAAVIEAMEAAYRVELAQACPEVQEDRLFEKALVNVCAHWALETLDWHLERTLEAEGRWGIADVRPRVLSRLETFLSLSETGNQLPVLHSLMNRLRDTLRARWPETEPLPLYPAFR